MSTPQKIGTLGGAIGLLFMFYQASRWLTELPKANEVLQDLHAELGALQPPSQAILVATHESRKPGQVLLTVTYSGPFSYPELRAYHDVELAKHGWTFMHEESLRNWGRDLGEKQAHYRKADYAAALFYAGTVAGSGYTYALDLSWGLR